MINFVIPDSVTITSNMRLHPQAKAKRVKALRTLGKTKSRGITGPEPCRIIAYLGFPDKRRRDPNNWADTTKALIDGLVDARVFTDDNHKIIQGPDHRIDSRKSERGFITVRFVAVRWEVENGE